MKKSAIFLFILFACFFKQSISQNNICDTVSLSSSGFDINPISAVINPLKSKNTLTVTNIGCNNLRVRPDFIISHESQALQTNDIASLKWQIPNVMAAPIQIASTAISINSIGQIVGYFSGLNGDSTGNDLNVNQTIGVEITVKLRPNAPFGQYSAFWFTNSVDSLGNIIDTVSTIDTTSLYYYNCNNFFIDSIITSNVSCPQNNDGSVDSIFTSTNYNYSALVLNSINDTLNINNLESGSYSLIVTDSFSGCLDTIGFTIGSDSLDYSPTVSNVSCFNGNDGKSSLITSGYFSNLSPNNNTYCQMEPLYDFLQSIDTVILQGEGDSIYNITSGLCDKYEDYTSQTATLFKGQSYDLKIGLNSCLGYYNDVASVYIDWNNDGDFDDSNEFIDSTLKTLSPSSHNISITVPQNANIGITRMRIISNQDTARTTSCLVGTMSNFYWTGAVEDYSLSIVSTSSLNINGGTPPYTINWYGKDTNALNAGFHKYTISDNGGCQVTDSVYINQPDSININAVINDVNCFDDSSGSINLIITGGNPPFNFSWSNGDTTSDISNLFSGEYILTTTDSLGCSFVDTFNVNQPNNPITTINTINNVVCFGDSSGSVTINISGGTPSYTLSAFGNTLPVVSTNSFTTPSIIPAGIYPFLVTDSNLCVHYDTIIISQNADIIANYITTDISCFGFNDGSVSLNITGGLSPYTQSWFGADTNALGYGYHPFIVTDSSGCTLNDSIFINEPQELTANATISNVSCYGLSDGNVSLSISGGTAPYLQNWNGFNYNQLSAGTYYYLVSDTNNCTFFDSVNVSQPDSLFSTSIVSNVLCYGDSSGSASISIFGGTAPYTQNWFGVNNYSLQAGNYIYILSDTNGCVFLDSVIIS